MAKNPSEKPEHSLIDVDKYSDFELSDQEGKMSEEVLEPENKGEASNSRKNKTRAAVKKSEEPQTAFKPNNPPSKLGKTKASLVPTNNADAPLETLKKSQTAVHSTNKGKAPERTREFGKASESQAKETPVPHVDKGKAPARKFDEDKAPVSHVQYSNTTWGNNDSRCGGTGHEEETSDHEEDNLTNLTLDIETLIMMEELYEERHKITSRDDPRLTELEVSFHICMLKVAGIIHETMPHRKWSERPTKRERALMKDKQDRWALFRHLYRMAKNTEVPMDDDYYAVLQREMHHLAQRVLEKAQVVISTTVQGNMELLQDIKFPRVITDESSTMTLADLLLVWKEDAVLVMMGDDQQLRV